LTQTPPPTDHGSPITDGQRLSAYREVPAEEGRNLGSPPVQVGETVATVWFADNQDSGSPGIGWPRWSRTWAVSCSLAPSVEGQL
jgi:hypothetical protein